MITTPMRRIIVPFTALIAAGGVAFAFGIQLVHRGSRSDISTGTAPSPVSTSGSKAPHQEQATLGPSRLESDSGVATPTFDIARIEPTGEAVIAGRATPGATVELLGDGNVLNAVVADRSGEFVMVPPRLPSGTYKLTLRSKLPDGTQLVSKQSVVAALEPRPDQRPIAPLTPDKRDFVSSQSATPKAGKAMDGTLLLEAIAIAPGGKLNVQGRARPGAAIRLYLNDSVVASVTAGADQRFAVTINEGVKSGRYRVRLDELEANSGAVLARSELPFDVPVEIAASSAPLQNKALSPENTPEKQTGAVAAMPQLPTDSRSNVIVPKILTTTVAQGDSLWRISRDTYGAGERYRVIFGANRKQIHNPNLIYPGQIFVLPAR
jgi:nucleoid-associated protein YgaU